MEAVLKIHVQNVQWCTLKFWFSILKLLDLHDIFPFLYNFAHKIFTHWLSKHNGHLISLAKFCDVCDDHPPKHHTQN